MTHHSADPPLHRRVSKPPSPAGLRTALFVATCGYLGYAPVAPGTFGSAAGLALFFALR